MMTMIIRILVQDDVPLRFQEQLPAHLLSHILAALQVVVSVGEDLRLDDWNNAVL